MTTVNNQFNFVAVYFQSAADEAAGLSNGRIVPMDAVFEFIRNTGARPSLAMTQEHIDNCTIRANGRGGFWRDTNEGSWARSEWTREGQHTIVIGNYSPMTIAADPAFTPAMRVAA
jgi:hypothetical protein